MENDYGTCTKEESDDEEFGLSAPKSRTGRLSFIARAVPKFKWGLVTNFLISI